MPDKFMTSKQLAPPPPNLALIIRILVSDVADKHPAPLLIALEVRASDPHQRLTRPRIQGLDILLGHVAAGFVFAPGYIVRPLLWLQNTNEKKRGGGLLKVVGF